MSDGQISLLERAELQRAYERLCGVRKMAGYCRKYAEETVVLCARQGEQAGSGSPRIDVHHSTLKDLMTAVEALARAEDTLRTHLAGLDSATPQWNKK